MNLTLESFYKLFSKIYGKDASIDLIQSLSYREGANLIVSIQLSKKYQEEINKNEELYLKIEDLLEQI